MSCGCGNENCNGVCSYSIGERLYSFMNSHRFTETTIGDVEDDILDKRQKFIVIGTEITRDGNSRLMVPVGRYDIPLGKKFDGIADAKTALKEYINKTETADRKVLDKLIQFENNRLVSVPFKVNTACNLKYKRNDGKELTVKTKLEKIRWTINKEDKKFKCYLVTDMFNYDNNKRFVLGLEDYGDTIIPIDEGSYYNKAYLQSHIISFNKFGYINPIEIKTKDASIIIDNKSLFLKTNNNYQAKVIGGWCDGKLKYDKEIAKKYIKNDKVFKVIENNEVYIKVFRHSIAPYLIAETNVVEVKR